MVLGRHIKQKVIIDLFINMKNLFWNYIISVKTIWVIFQIFHYNLWMVAEMLLVISILFSWNLNRIHGWWNRDSIGFAIVNSLWIWNRNPVFPCNQGQAILFDLIYILFWVLLSFRRRIHNFHNFIISFAI